MSELISLQETAKRLGVHPDTVRRWVKRDPLFPAPVRLPNSNRMRFKAAEVEAFIVAERQS